jgi:ABC-type branched-subunit amino acid transport system ATPase component/ABC-type branched-subunit amino acid transport system permease subunit
MTLAFVPTEVVVSGIITGLTYGLMAVGIILVYRSSRVINLALAAMGGLGAAVLARLVINQHLSYWASFAIVGAVGAAVGWLVERVVVRRLFEAPRVIVMVATIGVAQLLLFGQAVLPQPSSVAAYPMPFRASWTVAGVTLDGSELSILVIVPLLAGALALFFNRTRVGVGMRAAAANPDTARLSGISVRRMSSLAWVMAGVLATIGTVLSAPVTTTTAGDVLIIGPGLLVRVLVAAVIGRMVSPTGAMVGGVGVGITESVVFYYQPDNPGILDLLLLVVLLVALIPFMRRVAGAEIASRWSFAPRIRPVPSELAGRWWVRRMPQMGYCGAVAVGLLPLLVVHGASQRQLWSTVLLSAMVALSLTVLTGWTGQVSLGQYAFVGLGAMTTAALVDRGVGFAPSLGAAAIIGCAAAVVVGLPALRVPGLFLAVTTLAFAVATASWFLSQGVFLQGNPTVTMLRAVVGRFSLVPEGTYYGLCLVALAFVVFVVANIRRSGFGRALIAVRDNERSVAALGLSPARLKVTAFAISGAIAGFAGGLFAGLYVTFGPDSFGAPESLTAIAVVVVGGMSSAPGAVLGALFVVGIPVLFSNDPNVGLLVGGLGVLVVLLAFPGGLAQILYQGRDVLLRWAARRPTGVPREPAPTAVAAALPAMTRGRTPDGDPAQPALEVRGLTVRFGPVVAVDQLDLVVGRGEVVGLIGSNGAGKTTVMNALGGFVPATGEMRIHGTDVHHAPPARRARLGLGRTFQGAELFGDLTVRETVALAREPSTHSALPVLMLGLPRQRRRERRAMIEADEILCFLRLGEFANRYVNELSTGTRRIVELACLLGTGARVLCLDEPTAGLSQREGEAFVPTILEVQRALDASLLLIEHDMGVVMTASDRLYCLEAGRLISEGSPEVVRTDPLVLESYLGVDPRSHQA